MISLIQDFCLVSWYTLRIKREASVILARERHCEVYLYTSQVYCQANNSYSTSYGRWINIVSLLKGLLLTIRYLKNWNLTRVWVLNLPYKTVLVLYGWYGVSTPLPVRGQALLPAVISLGGFFLFIEQI